MSLTLNRSKLISNKALSLLYLYLDFGFFNVIFFKKVN